MWPNISLDRGGGRVFRIKRGAAKLKEIAPPGQLLRSAFSLDMKRLALTGVLIIVTVAGNSRPVQAQKNSDDWITVRACNVSLQLPPNLKRNRNEGIDSCVAQFESGETFLLLDYGTWGGAAKNSGNTLNFAEESFEVDGKTGRLATYIMYVGDNREQRFVAHLYIETEAARGPYGRPTSLMLTLTSRNEKDLDLARRIFRSIRFSQETRNKSLDQSGENVFRIKLCAAKVE